VTECIETQNLFWRFGSEPINAHLCVDGYVTECDCMTAHRPKESVWK
jgi:hypothetical protein